jgi:hypothetical protein
MLYYLFANPERLPCCQPVPVHPTPRHGGCLPSSAGQILKHALKRQAMCRYRAMVHYNCGKWEFP